jgi:hypothetical protein
MACDIIEVPPIRDLNLLGVIVNLGGDRRTGLTVSVDEDEGLLGAILEPILCQEGGLSQLGELLGALGTILEALDGLDLSGAADAAGARQASDADSDAEEDEDEDFEDDDEDEDEEDSIADQPPAKPKSKPKAKPRARS